MDPFIQQTIDGYASGFSAFDIKDEALLAEIEAWKEDMNKLGSECSDAMTFMDKLGTSGLQAKQMDLITRASTPAPTTNDQGEVDGPNKDFDPSKVKLPTVKEFLEQFRPAYDAVKAQGYRKRGEAAYKNIFNVANRTDDLLEMNIILEEEDLNWKIVTEDMIDIFDALNQATDPNNEAFKKQFVSTIALYNEVICDDELSYKIESLNQTNNKRHKTFITKMLIPLTLSKALLEYYHIKIGFRGFEEPERDLKAAIGKREAIRRFYQYVQDTFGWTFDDMMNDPWMKQWFLLPRPADDLFRIKIVLDPANLKMFRHQLDEAISDDLIEDIMLREEPYGMCYLHNNDADAINANYMEEAKRRNADLVYFQYTESLKKEAPEGNHSVDDATVGSFTNN